MTGSATSDFGARLHGVAIDFVVPTGDPRIDQAGALAEDLVASGFTGDATVEVAALRRDAARSHAEPLVRNMLAEHGIDLPTPADKDGEYRLLLRAFGFWDLPIGDFCAPFLHRLSAWDMQDGLEVVRSQQRLVRAAQRGRAAVVATLAQELRGWVVVFDATHAPSEQAGAPDADAVAGLRHIADEAAASGKHSLLTALQAQPVYLVPLGPVDNRRGTLCVDGRSLAEDPAQRSGIVGAAAAVLSVLESTADASVKQVIVELLLADDSASARRVCKASGISLPDPLVAVGLTGPKRHQALARAVSLGAWRVPTRSATTVVVLATPGIIETRLPTLVEQTGTRAGVSSPHSPKDVPRAVQEAMSSLTLAREARRVVSHPETTSSGLKGVLGSESTRQFVAALFSPLEGHPDRQLLLTSASAWVHAHGRWDPAAAALGIHRETLRGRMKRLATTLSLDLGVPQDRLALSLAIQFLPPPEWEGWE